MHKVEGRLSRNHTPGAETERQASRCPHAAVRPTPGAAELPPDRIFFLTFDKLALKPVVYILAFQFI